MIKGPSPRQSTTATLWKHSVLSCVCRERERAGGRAVESRARERERERKTFFLGEQFASIVWSIGILASFTHLTHKFSQVKFCFQTEETEAFVMAPKLPQLHGTLFKYGSKSIQVFVSPFFPYTRYFFSVAHLHNLKDFSISLEICTCGSSSFFSLFPSVFLFVFLSVL